MEPMFNDACWFDNTCSIRADWLFYFISLQLHLGSKLADSDQNFEIAIEMTFR